MRWWWAATRNTARIVATVAWRLKGHGARNVPATGGVLLASNHQSYVDPPAVACCLDREIHFMARRTLFEIPVLGPLIVALNSFPIDRDSGDVKGVKTAIERLRAGAALLMFPEGTRTRDGRIGRMKAGIRLVAERAAVPIVPVLIEGAFRVWPKGRLLPLPWGRIDVVFGPPSDPSTLSGDRLRVAVEGLKKELSRIREKEKHVQQETRA